jgi:putative RecB family exonuclease
MESEVEMIAINGEIHSVGNRVGDVLLEPVSASRLNAFHSCRLKFYFRYILKLRKPVGAALHVGKSVHAALQEWSKQRWHSKPSKSEDLRAGFTDHWISLQAEDPVDFEPGEEAAEQSKAWGLVEMYLRETPIPSAEKPLAVEVAVDTDLASHGLPVLRGVIDLIRPGGKIVDFKTTATTPNESQAEHRNQLQLTAYALLYREATGEKESGFELHHLVKTKTPKLVITTHDPVDVKQESKLFRSIESYVDGVEREDWIASPGLQCVACEFFHECKGGAL